QPPFPFLWNNPNKNTAMSSVLCHLEVVINGEDFFRQARRKTQANPKVRRGFATQPGGKKIGVYKVLGDAGH
ncbi:MAG: hypothetical protein LBS32_05920, partial [Clostridiales Family XIII bacterium]|nr:hypothetical protein [Clostridiales Family XIII bacterium]